MILSVSANAEIKAYVSAALEAYRPILFGLDLELKVGASIRILFIKVSFSFHFSMHMDFSIGEASKTPWKLAGPGMRRNIPGGYCPRRMHAFVEKAGFRRPLCVKRELLRVGENFAAYFKERTRLVIQPVPVDAADQEERGGVFFPAVPGLSFTWQTFGPDGEMTDEDTVSFADEPLVDGTYIEMLQEYFARLNPSPEEYDGKENRMSVGYEQTGEKALSEVLLEDYLSVILQAVTGEARRHARGVRIRTEGKTLRELAESFHDIQVPFQKRHGENWASMSDALGMTADALRMRNPSPEDMEDGEYRDISVGVTPHSILLDNPSWKFAADEIMVEGKTYKTAGSSVEQVLYQNRIPLDALIQAVQDDPGVFAGDVITVRNVPALEREEIICLQPRTTYTDAWRTGLTEYIREWEKQHSPPVYGRYLRIGITVFSTELQAKGVPVVKLEEIRLTESQ